MKKGNWRAGKILGIALLCVVMASVAFVVVRNMRGTAGLEVYPETTAAAEDPTQEGTRLPAAVANWAPAARPESRSAALLPSLNTEAALALVAQGFKSVVLPETALTEQDIAMAGEVLDALKGQDVFRTVMLTPVEEFQLDAFGQALGQLIADSSFDALMLSDNSGADADGAMTTLFTHYLTQLLGEAGLSLPIIFDVGNLEKMATPYQEAIVLLAGSLEKGELLVHGSPSKAQQLGAQAKQLAGELPVSALFDLKAAIPNGTLQETLDFLTALQAARDLPLVLRSAGFLPKNQEAAGLLQKFYTGGLDLINASKGLGLSKPVKSLKSQQDIHTDKPVVNFTGTSSPLFALTCNGKDVQRNESGDFSMDMPLQPGKNVFLFEHQGKKYVVNVYYDVTVLVSVTPRGGIETTGGIDLVVGAVARRGSTVKAALGPQSITLQPGSAGGEDGINANSEKDSEFINYVGTFKLDASGSKKVVLGTLIFTAAYQGLSEKMNGALVTLLPAVPDTPPPPEPTTTTTTADSATSSTSDDATSSTPDNNSNTTIPDAATSAGETTTATDAATTTTADPTQPPEPPTDSKPSGSLLTPYSNNGLGTAQMVEITEAWANARWSNTTDTKFNPTASPLLAGSFDYVSGKQVVDGTTYYLLGSGKRIKSTDLKVIDKGYKLPLNQLQAISSTGTGALVMRFGVDWKIPFNVDLIGQKYTASEGFNGNDFGVTAFNATGLEITFYHTANYSGWVSVGSFPLMASAEWYRDTSKNTVTLRLMFKDAGRFYGWQAYYDGGELVIRIRPKPPSSLKGAVVWLDAGHGGTDWGSILAASHATLKYEKHVNLLIANKIKAKLEAAGATVYITRTSDTYISPAERVRMTRQRNPDMFISIHCDSTETAAPSGTSAFYYRAFGRPLAKAIHDRIVATYRNNIYVAGNGIDNYVQMRDKVDRKTYFYPFEVTRIEECPAVLIEYGFGSNLTECRVLQTDKYQELFAQATVDGISDWLKAQ